MIVMLANNTGIEVGYLVGKYEGRIGHLYSPQRKTRPFVPVPYALDNGAFYAFTRQEPWDEAQFVRHLGWYRYCKHQPRWVVVPDVVGDRAATLALWVRWAPRLREYGWPLAFAAQDGMTAVDVPADADVVFVGGSTEWKWNTVHRWGRDFSRVHVGRVNCYRRLWDCHDAGAESCDGTGWCRGDREQMRGLYQYLAESSGQKIRQQVQLFPLGRSA